MTDSDEERHHKYGLPWEDASQSDEQDASPDTPRKSGSGPPTAAYLWEGYEYLKTSGREQVTIEHPKKLGAGEAFSVVPDSVEELVRRQDHEEDKAEAVKEAKKLAEYKGVDLARKIARMCGDINEFQDMIEEKAQELREEVED